MAGRIFKAVIEGKGWGPTGHGPPPTDDLTPPTRDSLFLYQLATNDPTALTEASLWTAKIVETHHYAGKVFASCTKAGVIDSKGHPDTTKISSALVSKIGIISVPKQRELVNMLFFWEEELTRWKLLDEEIGELQAALTVEGLDPSEQALIDERLKMVQAKWKVVPSQRHQDGSLKEPAQSHPPPAYSA